MLRVLRFPEGLALALISCAALAQQPSPPPTSPAASPQANAPADAPAASAAPVPHAPSGGAAPPLQACAVKAFDDYAAAMSAWEHDWAKGVFDQRPEFRSAVIARNNAHNTALQRDGLRIHYLADNAPESLNVEDSIASLRLFDWTQAQEQALRQTEPAYDTVADAAEHARTAADAEPKSQALESYFEDSFTGSADTGAGRQLHTLLDQGDAALKYCREHYPAVPPAADCPGCAGSPVAAAPSDGPAKASPQVPAQIPVPAPVQTPAQAAPEAPPLPRP